MVLDDVKKIFNKYEKLVPSPDVAFLIEIPENVAMQRKNDIPSQSYIRIRNELYRQFASREEIVALNGTFPLNQLRVEVLNILSSRLGIN
jgi:dTMP kinase